MMPQFMAKFSLEEYILAMDWGLNCQPIRDGIFRLHLKRLMRFRRSFQVKQDYLTLICGGKIIHSRAEACDR